MNQETFEVQPPTPNITGSATPQRPIKRHAVAAWVHPIRLILWQLWLYEQFMGDVGGQR